MVREAQSVKEKQLDEKQCRVLEVDVAWDDCIAYEYCIRRRLY